MKSWHRYYDPDTGRYISADPIGLRGGINLYSYVGASPTNRADPRGLKWGMSDFVDHYINGGGTTVNLSQIGLLGDFTYSDSVSGAVNRVENGYKQMLKKRLFSKCTNGCGTVSDSFNAHHFDETYDVTWASTNLFSLGDGELFNKGTCKGTADCQTGKWSGSCDLRFYIRDWFKDPYGVGLETGTVYRINGDWNAWFSWSE